MSALANSNAAESTGQRPPVDLDLDGVLAVAGIERVPNTVGGPAPLAPEGRGVHTVVRPAVHVRPIFIREYGQHVAPFLSGAHGVLGFDDRREHPGGARTPWNDQQRYQRTPPAGSWDDGAVLGQDL